MKTTMDAAGRLVIPKEVRRAANLAPGVTLDVHWRDGRIEIEPAATQVQLKKRGRLWVAVPDEKIDALTPEQVEQARSALLDERSGGQ